MTSGLCFLLPPLSLSLIVMGCESASEHYKAKCRATGERAGACRIARGDNAGARSSLPLKMLPGVCGWASQVIAEGPFKIGVKGSRCPRPHIRKVHWRAITHTTETRGCCASARVQRNISRARRVQWEKVSLALAAAREWRDRVRLKE